MTRGRCQRSVDCGWVPPASGLTHLPRAAPRTAARAHSAGRRARLRSRRCGGRGGDAGRAAVCRAAAHCGGSVAGAPHPGVPRRWMLRPASMRCCASGDRSGRSSRLLARGWPRSRFLIRPPSRRWRPSTASRSWTAEDPRITPARGRDDGPGEQVGVRAGRPRGPHHCRGRDWHTVNDAVMAYGAALIDADTECIGAVDALGVDEILFCRTGRWWSATVRQSNVADDPSRLRRAAPRQRRDRRAVAESPSPA
jgi:hypothetical protein